MPEWKDISLRFRWFLTCLIFFALPFLLITGGLAKKWDVREREITERSFSRLDSILMFTRSHEDTAEYFRLLLERLCDKANRATDPVPLLKSGFSNLKERFPGIFKMYAVDGNGNTIPELTEPGTPNAPLKRLYKIQQSKAAAAVIDEEFNRSFGMIKSFVGPQAIPMAIKRTHYFLAATLTNENHWFFFSTSSKLGIYAHLNFMPGFDLLSTRDACSRFQKANPGTETRVGLYSISELPPEVSGFKAALKEFGVTNNPHLVKEQRLFSFMPFSSTSYLWGSTPVPRLEEMHFRRVLFPCFGILIFALLAWQSYRVMVWHIPMHFPIRWRLIALFGFASGLPIAVIIFAGWDYADQTYRNRIRESHEEGERLLKTFDAKFRQMLGTWENQLNVTMKKCHYETPAEIRHTTRVIAQIHRQFPESGATLFNKKGEFIQGKKSENFAFRFLGGLSRKLIANFNHEEEAGGSIDATSLLLESVQGQSNPFEEMSRNLGSIISISFGNSESWAYAYPLLDRFGKATHLIYVDWRKIALERIYVAKSLRPAMRRLGGIRLFATTNKLANLFPPAETHTRELERFFRDVQLRQGTTFGRVTLSGSPFLLTGIKPKELSAHYLAAVLPEKKIQAEIKLLEGRIWGLSLISGIISLFLGYLLSQRFLTPIGHLSEGVEAIRQRNFDHRLPRGENDELGELAATFNHVMAGLSELEVARIVQESLLPSGEIQTGEYRIFGKTVTSTELGGDYFELETFPDGRVLMLIGDVTGHGVPAALVMAMAKALVAARTFEGSNAPEAILDIMHKVIFKTLKRKRLMTCFIALLDPVQHKLYFANAGQNFPYYIPAGKEPRHLELPSGPLGSKKILAFKAESLDLAPGDKILFYTDGIVEQKMQTGDMIGYTRMIASVAPLLTDDPRESYAKTFAWDKQIIGTENQDDDVTIVLLCRQSGPTVPFPSIPPLGG